MSRFIYKFHKLLLQENLWRVAVFVSMGMLRIEIKIVPLTIILSLSGMKKATNGYERIDIHPDLTLAHRLGSLLASAAILTPMALPRLIQALCFHSGRKFYPIARIFRTTTYPTAVSLDAQTRLPVVTGSTAGERGAGSFEPAVKLGLTKSMGLVHEYI